MPIIPVRHIFHEIEFGPSRDSTMLGRHLDEFPIRNQVGYFQPIIPSIRQQNAWVGLVVKKTIEWVLVHCSYKLNSRLNKEVAIFVGVIHFLARLQMMPLPLSVLFASGAADLERHGMLAGRLFGSRTFNAVSSCVNGTLPTPRSSTFCTLPNAGLAVVASEAMTASRPGQPITKA